MYADAELGAARRGRWRPRADEQAAEANGAAAHAKLHDKLEELDGPLPPRSRPRAVLKAARVADHGSIRSVCVIGGGPSGLSCCRRLCDAGLEVTLVQESRGLGGKMCTKFVNGKDDPTLHFDMGVQLLRPMGPLVDNLQGVVEPWPLPGRFKRLMCTGDWNSWRIRQVADLDTDGFVVGVPSMSAIGRHLANQCKGLTVHVDRTAVVRGQCPKSGVWEVEWKREEATAGQLRYRPELANVPMEIGRCDFDAVVLAFEANKILRGCKSGYKMVESSATTPIRQQLGKRTRTSQMWNLMVAFDIELAMPWDAATVEGHRSIAWVAVDSSKPQRAALPQCFMVFSTQEWADWKQWGKREVERDLLEEFMVLLEQVLGRRPPKPCFVLSGRWGNNTEVTLTGERGDGQFPMRALGLREQPAPAVWDGTGRMGATGDWTRGFSVSDAYVAGQEMADALLADAR